MEVKAEVNWMQFGVTAPSGNTDAKDAQVLARRLRPCLELYARITSIELFTKKLG